MSLARRGILVGVLLVGAWLRVVEIGPAFLFGDELHSLGDMQGGYLHLLGTFSDTGSGMLLPLWQRALVDVFGAGHWAIRAPAWSAGLLLLALTYPIARRRMGEGLAVAVTALVALSPILVFYSYFARIYALCALLALLLLDRVEALLGAEEGGAERRDWLWLLGLTALLPYAHPTALAFVVPVYCAAIGAAAVDPRRRPLALRLAGTLALAGALCLFAHLPAWSSLDAFVSNKTTTPYSGSFGSLDVVALLFGGRGFGLAMLVLCVAAAAGVWRRSGALAAPLLAACAGPAVVIALVSPYGDAYAYARYVLPGLVPSFLLLGRGADALLEARGRAAAPGPQLAAALGGAAVALLVALPLLGAAATRSHGRHAATYLAMRALPPFDRPWPGASPFYARLAEAVREDPSLRVVEAPALTTRTRHLYRTLERQHGADTLLAPFPREFPRIPDGPYVSLDAPGAIEDAGVDYVIVHLDVAREVERYWAFVYAQPDADAPADRAYMERHRQYGGLLPTPPPGLLARLTARFGEPIYRDDDVVVFRTRREAG